MNAEVNGKNKSVSEPYGSASGGGGNQAETFEFLPPGVGQNCPQDYPHSERNPKRRNSIDPLGEALSIAEVAELLGCSVWTVRKKYLAAGPATFPDWQRRASSCSTARRSRDGFSNNRQFTEEGGGEIQMTLYKRGGFYWTAIWVDGVRHAKSTRTANKRLALKA